MAHGCQLQPIIPRLAERNGRLLYEQEKTATNDCNGRSGPTHKIILSNS